MAKQTTFQNSSRKDFGFSAAFFHINRGNPIKNALFMTLEIALLFLIILGMVVIMVTERMPTDMLALTLMVVLILGGFVSPGEGIAGLSNKATVTLVLFLANVKFQPLTPSFL